MKKSQLLGAVCACAFNLFLCVLAIALMIISVPVQALTIDFEGLPLSGNASCSSQFMSISANGFDFVSSSHSHICYSLRSDLASNGTDWFTHDSDLSVTMTEGSNNLFDFNSFDLAEVFDWHGPVAVSITGILSGGGSVSQSFLTDGVNDGTGSLNDFETFDLNSNFVNLKSVTFSGSYFGLDNLVVSSLHAPTVPIPSALWLFGSGLLGLIGIAKCKKSA